MSPQIPEPGFAPGYALRVLQTRTDLKRAVLEEIARSLDMTSSVHNPDPAWDAITAAAKEMIVAQDEWVAYIDRKRQDHLNVGDLPSEGETQ